jgi:hypothetical protein
MFKLDKEKYHQIVRTEGLNSALTRLYRDTETWELDTFEGENGYKPAQWETLREVRAFARELWDIGLKNSAGSSSS